MMHVVNKKDTGFTDFEAIRRDFPIFEREVNGKPLTFLDSAASAQKPRQVIERVASLYQQEYANIHRGIYKLSQDATEAYEETRDKVRALINARDRRECIFVSGATDGINLVAQAYGRTFLGQGDEIILTELEHHSNIVPWQLLRDQIGCVIKVAPINDAGEIELDRFKALLGPRTKLVATTHISNAIGTIAPVREMIRLAHEAGALVLVDGCQAVPHGPVDVQELEADFYAFSAHKIYGPTGLGVLYGKEEHLEKMPPWRGGGDMIETVTFEKTTYNELPHKFEAGTPNIAGGIGFGTAIDYVTTIGYDDIMRHDKMLLDYATASLRGINSLRIVGESRQKSSILSFVLDDIHPHDAGTILDQEGIAVRTGHHCAQPLMARFGVTATIRASLGIYNSTGDIDRLTAGIKKTLDIFRP